MRYEARTACTSGNRPAPTSFCKALPRIADFESKNAARSESSALRMASNVGMDVQGIAGDSLPALFRFII